jgi:hypothetical protein
VLVDELGRGTSNADGVALALAVAERLALACPCAYTLFVTHYPQVMMPLSTAPLHGPLSAHPARIVAVSISPFDHSYHTPLLPLPISLRPIPSCAAVSSRPWPACTAACATCTCAPPWTPLPSPCRWGVRALRALTPYPFSTPKRRSRSLALRIEPLLPTCTYKIAPTTPTSDDTAPAALGLRVQPQPHAPSAPGAGLASGGHVKFLHVVGEGACDMQVRTTHQASLLI